ncbi:complement C1q tumor necrosis factor-related protein 2-like [Babylonia areolata]|uniref:complement C1q tumor necrosis factor-related protein 2-like n=1 Tax=Babylonia areolata TaxID=304850 RepID=UPI003FD19DAD
MAVLEMEHLEEIKVSLQNGQDSLQSEIAKIKTSHEDSLRTTGSVITELKARLGQGRRLFYARELNKDATRQGDTMRFDHVEFNEGGHFNADSGKFTAPRAGLYCFTATVASRTPGVTAYGHIMTGDVSCCAVQGDHWGQTGTRVVWLVAGERVWVRAASPVSDYIDRRGLFLALCDFSGALLLSSR